MKRRKKAGLLCMALGVLLIAAAAGLLLYNQIEAANATRASGAVLPKLTGIIPELTEALPSPAEDSGEMPVAVIDGYEYIGYISIPALELELPVMSEWDYTRLKIAPCRYYGSANTDDLVIAGHNYASHFGGLSELSIGDTVRFTAMDGSVYTYSVGDIEVLLPSDTEKMISGGWELSLYTCTPNGAKRVTVRCERVF